MVMYSVSAWLAGIVDIAVGSYKFGFWVGGDGLRRRMGMGAGRLGREADRTKGKKKGVGWY